MTRRRRFAEWVDSHSPCSSRLLPITHIAGGVNAQRIVDEEKLDIPDKVEGSLGAPLVYLFYGRPAYRVKSGTSVQLEASCPCCFIFDPQLMKRCNEIFAFDTGAFFKRLYSHVMDDDFEVEDFSLANEPERIPKLISATFGSEEAYFDADRSLLRKVDDVSHPWDLEARSYLSLLSSPGRNEPDDRVGTIEVNFRDPVLLDEMLKGLIVPSTLWNGNSRAPFLVELDQRGVKIGTYKFSPGRHPEFLQAQMEIACKILFNELGFILDGQ